MPNNFFDEIHAEKYRAPGESFREAMCRVASALKDTDEHYHALKDILISQRFLPAGRVQAAMGSPRRVTAYNCAVAPMIKDSFTDGQDSIMDVAAKAAKTMRMGCGYGYDFSTLRPRGALIKSLGSRSSGPVAFMEIYDAVCRATMSAGHRRGAQMGVLRVDHPDIEEFVRAKQNTGRLTGFNVSVAVTDEFIRALSANNPFPLRWGTRDYGEIDPRALWEEIMRSAWDWGEPGVLFIDRINEWNNLWYCEEIAATKPCSEQPLPPNGTCLLGSFNLTKYVKPRADQYVDSLHGGIIDFELLHRDISAVILAMDNVVDRTIYPLSEQEAEAKSKRRMGLGVTGLANALEALGYSYGSPDFLRVEARVLEFIRDRCYTESAVIAAAKGPFPAFRRDDYLSGKFISTLPPAVRDLIAAHGTRNSHLLSIAPTGTISLCAGNVSSGIEPPFSLSTKRLVRGEDGFVEVSVTDYAAREWGVRGKTAPECSLDDHLNVLAVAQRYVDSAVSKTVNVDPGTPWADFEGLYLKAWSMGCKGLSTFNSGGKRLGILSSEDDAACRIDPETGTKTCE